MYDMYDINAFYKPAFAQIQEA